MSREQCFVRTGGPFQLPIIEHVNNIAMVAWHLDASLVLDESSSNSEDSVVLGFSVKDRSTCILAR